LLSHHAARRIRRHSCPLSPATPPCPPP
jgi:hypothetical protein